MRRLVLATALLLLALPVSAAAADGGPSPGLLTGWDGVLGPKGNVRYVALYAGSQTAVATIDVHTGRVLAQSAVKGAFGIPIVTTDGTTGGISRDGRTLVLGAWPSQTLTRFAVLNTRGLRLRNVITLRGSYSYDALSPDGSTLYLIQYTQGATSVRYRVRAFDLAAGRLLQRAIADKRLWGDYMRGSPIARATTADGGWVYTLYGKPDGTAFIHALDAAHRAAVCVNLPWRRAADGIATVRLALAGDRLVLRQRGLGTLASVDTRSFAVSAVRKPVVLRR